jgi:hypothetical protein
MSARQPQVRRGVDNDDDDHDNDDLKGDDDDAFMMR